MKRSIYLLTILLLVLITSCKDDQEIVSPGSDNKVAVKINLINMTGGETVKVGSAQIIKWYSNTTINSIDIEYSTNGGTKWDTLASNVPNSGAYLWAPVPNKVSNYCLLKISTRDQEKAIAYSSDFFSIVSDSTQKTLTLLSPNAASVVYVDSLYKISWSSKGIAGLKISLSTDNGATWGIIATNAPADTGSYWWRPTSNQQSNICKLKISDVAADSISAISSGVFTITVPQTITLLQPAGSETAFAGQSYDIKWTSSQVSNVKIEFTTDNGVSWNLITAGTPSNGYYSWNPVPSTISNNCKIRISDALDGFPVVTSLGVFSISKPPTLKITAPNGGEQFLAGTSTKITWTSESNAAAQPLGKKKTKSIEAQSTLTTESAAKPASPVSNVKIEYTTDDGANWKTITPNTINNGSYNWDTIPAVNSSLCKVKVSDVNGGIPFAVSSSNFTIYTQQAKLIKVLTPNGAEIWQSGTTQNITWASTAVTAVKIEYTTNNGVDWKTITNTTPSTGLYAWNSVPSTASNNCKVRITDVADANVYDLSDAVFSISPEPVITVLTPNGGEVYQSGSVKQITWTSVSIANVKIEYTVNGGADWKLIVADTVSSGIYNWTVPNENTTQAKIRISKAGTGIPFGVSAANFTINNQVVKQLTVLSPIGGEAWMAGTSQQIKWSGSGVLKVNIDFTADNGLTWSPIIANTASTGAYSWDPLPNVTSSQCLIRVSDAVDGKTTAVSNGPFSISPVKTITILKPVAGEVWTAGVPDTIKWQATGLSNVRIEYTVNNGLDSASWFNLTPSTASSGTYVTAFSLPSTQYKIRISGYPLNFPSVVSNGTFTVLEQPSITVLSPKDGDQLYAGASTNITWKSTNITDVKVEYTINNGASWSVITNSTPSNGLYRWVVPNDPLLNSSQCKIRVSNTLNNGIPSGTSTGTFSINQELPGIKVTSPNGGEVWFSGSSQIIKWNSTGVTNVKIDYTTNNGVDWIPVIATTPSNGFYNWNPVPNTSSTNCKVRISDLANNYTDLSDLNFTISPEPSIAIVSPNGGEQLTYKSLKNIQWTATNIAKVKLEYTTNSGANWIVIVDSVDNNGTYSWSVPNVNSNLCRIKVSEAKNGIPFAISAANFTINNQVIKQLSLTKPVGGEVWEGGTRQTISWTSSNVDKVVIQYTTQAGSANWITIDSNVVNSGAYEWTIPDVNSTLCKVRVKDVVVDGPEDESKNVFSITPVPFIKVVYPNGGEILTGGSLNFIRWTSAGVKNVKIENSTNNGLSWNSVIESTPNNGTYEWSTTIPSTQYKIKISNVISPNTPNDESDGTFTVTPEPSIKIITPNGGEQFVSGTSQNITWTSTNITNVKLEYTSNNGATWNSIKDDTLNAGFYKWIVPPVNSSLCKVKVSNAFNQNVPSNTSASTFTINQVAPVITVTSPVGGESWDAGSAQQIKWNSSNISNVKIDYTTNNGVSWVPVVANIPSDGFFSWNPVPNTPSTNCKIRVSDIQNNYVGQSPLTFTIAPEPAISVTAPVGGEVYQSGSVKQITWTSVNIARVKIEYTVNGGAEWKLIVSDTLSSGVYNWTVPNENTAQARVRISKAGAGIPFGISAANFTISNQVVKQLTIISPNGGETWSAGTSQQIKWGGSGVINVKIEYTTDNGMNWNVIVASTPGTGAYSWDPIPNVTSTQCLVRISDAITGNPSTVSNAPFTINPVRTLNIVKPVAGDVWTAGVPDTIKWVSTGLSNVQIEYTINNNNNWLTLTPSTASNGSYVAAFSVPSALYKVRISGVPEGYPSVESNGTFTVLEQPSITVLAPKDGDQLLAGTSKDILWNSTNVTNVKIELTTNNGASWSVISAASPSNGRYQWTVPSDPPVNSSLCKIRISNAAGNGLPSALSTGNFTINQVAPGVTVTSPNGGESWDGGSAQTIKWNSVGVTNVKIEYTTNNGSSWTQIVASVPSNGFYSWNPIPNTPSTNCKIKISDVLNNYVDQSDGFFTLAPEPAIAVTAPVGGEVYQSGSVKQITWTSVNIARVKIEYTINGGAEWKLIASDTLSSGVYNWTVPNENTAQARVRISKAGTGIPFGISAANFTISNQVVKQLTMISPIGGETWNGGTSQQIKWSGSGVTNVKIEYTTDNGLNWIVIIANTPSTGAYSWNPIPDITSTQCLIRVSDVNAGGPSAVSNAPFSINPVKTLKIVKPVAGDIWTAGVQDTIKWTSTGISNVKIEYTTNNALTPSDWITLTPSTASNGTYVAAFSVPSTLYKVRLSGVPDGFPSVESNGTFTVLEQPSITVTAPKDGDQLYGGTSTNITWKSTNITDVKIEYTTNNGASWTVITNSTSSNGLYRWSVPSDANLNSSQCRVRISNTANNGLPSGTSTGSFSINQELPGIKVTAPNGGEVWFSGSAQIIKWNSTGITSVKIEYTTNNGVDWSTIVTSTQSNGFYNWNPVPNTTSTNCKVRISDLANKYIDLSDNNFTISPEPAIAVTSPNGGEQLVFPSTKNITWTSTNIAKVKLEYTTNNGANWFVIIDSTESIGTYAWVLPNVNSNQCRVRVSEYKSGFPSAISASNFTITNQIVKQISLIKPIGGEVWQGGTSQVISWTASGVTNITLEYTINNGLKWDTIKTNIASSGAYEWTIPNVNSTQCKVRVKDAFTGIPVDESKNVFTITPVPFITVTNPNGGETIIGGSLYNIKWLSAGVQNVKIEGSTNNGLSWNSIIESTPSNGSYSWSTTIPSTQYKIKISNVISPNTPNDESDGTFTVTPEPSIKIISPNGGEQFVAGTSQNITWTATNITNVKLEFTSNNGATWNLIKDDTLNTGLYKWVIPAINSSLCKVRVSNAFNENIPSNTSASTFTINQVAPVITVTSPVGGESWDAGSAQQIKWNSSNISNVKIDYTTNNGVSWVPVVANIPSDGFFSWNPVPNTPSTNCKVRVSDIQNNYVGQSPLTFTIAPEPAISVTAPIGGEVYQSGSVKQITWTSVNIARVKIEYTVNGGAEWKLIVSDTLSSGVYNWTVPNENTAQARVRISKAGTGIPFGISAANFTISNQVVKQLAMISPNGGENWSAGTSQQIKWSGSGVTNVKLEYTTDNGLNWNVIIASTPSSGAYTWGPIPNVTSTQCLVRVSEAATGAPSAVSNAPFTINPVKTLSIIKPVAGDVWTAGVPDTIKWTSTGISNVKIEYTINNGLKADDWITLTAGTASTGAYVAAFSVPSVLYKVRITGTPDGYPSVESNGTFTVLDQPSITVTAPKDGDQLLAGTSKDILWNSTNITNVKIELTTNNGASWSTISASAPSNGRYPWVVPVDSTINSSLCKIRISNTLNNGTPSAMSTGSFTINQVAPGITVTSPNGGESWDGGSAQVITWNSFGVSDVKIEYTSDNGINWVQIDANTPSDGFYSWNPIPNTPSTNCKIKISDIKNNYVGQSNSFFTIAPEPRITVKYPNGNENLKTGSECQIRWISENVAKIKIEYTVNGGADWKLIVADTLSGGVYNWIVPNENTEQAKIRVSKAGTGVPFGQSANNFIINNQIIKQLAIISPIGGENWSAGTSQQIKWSGTGVSNVKIEYTTDNGNNWVTIITSTPSTGSYSWGPIPDITSAQCLIRLSDVVLGGPRAQSNATFTINPVKTLKILKPVSGDIWIAGVADTIKWSSSGLTNVKIEYTVNNGLKPEDWNILTESEVSDGEYVTGFSIPSALYKIRISGLPDGFPSAESNGTFTVLDQPSITVTSPKQGDIFVAGTSQNIEWKSTNITNVKIEFTTNNGATWITIVDNIPTTGLYKWVVPGAINSSLCQVRISNVENNGNPSAMSIGSFTINQVAPSITVTSPNGGEVWFGSSAQIIKWNSTGITNVKIEYTTNNGVDWSTIIANTQSNGYYNWNPIPNISSTNCKIRVSDLTNNYTDLSDNVFTISPEPSISVTSPNGGENLLAGSSKNITWTSTNISKVKLEYTTNNGAEWFTIIDSVASTGNYAWTVPNVNSNLCRVKVSEARNGIPWAISTNNFTINNQIVKEVTLLSPVGGESWPAKTSQMILWKATGITKVDLDYTTNNGISWINITSNLISTGAFEWGPLPDINSTQCKVRISDSTGTAKDESKNVFSISPVPSIRVKSPNGGESWLGGEIHSISWTSKGVANVKIEVTTDNGFSWSTVIGSTPSSDSSTYAWSSSIPSQYYKIRVSNVANFGVPADESDGTFTVTPEPSIVVVSPNGGENLMAGQTHEIRWVSSNISFVKIEYTIDNGAKWIRIYDPKTGDGDFVSNGIYNWAINSDSILYRSDLCKIRITEKDGMQHSDVSDGLFSIHPKNKLLRLTYPNGGEVITTQADAFTIKWTSAGIDSVKLEYTLDNGGEYGKTWYTITNSIPSSGAYVWFYKLANPMYASTLARIRVTEIVHNINGLPGYVPDTLQDVSDSYFTLDIPPTATVIIDPGSLFNEVEAGASRPIKWTSAKDFKNFRLEYSADAGQSWQLIKDNIPNEIVNNFNWTIPAELAEKSIKYRVVDISSGKAFESNKFNVLK